MRCNPSYWLLGLLPIALLSWIAVQFSHEAIEADLGQRAQDALRRSGLDWAAPVFSGRDAILRGRSLEESGPARALSRVRDVWGVRVIHSNAELVEQVDRFVWSATNRGNASIQLAGYVANDSARESVVAMATKRFPDKRIIDGMRIARGAPSERLWLNATGFALQQLGQLKTGSAELDALELTVVGEAATSETYTDVLAALRRRLPSGVSLGGARITPPRIDPYVWSARSDGNRIRIAGYAPNDKLRKDLAARASSVFRTDAVVNDMKIGEGAPDAWPTAAAISLDQLALLKSGRVRMSGRNIEIQGEAPDEDTADRVRRSLKSNIPQAYRLTEKITAPEAETNEPAGGYTMGIVNTGTAVELTGYVPSEAARAALVDAVGARFPGRDVTDKLEVLNGAPEGWQQCIVAGLAALPHLKTGRAVLTDQALAVSGSTDDFGVAEATPADVKAAAGQTCVTNVDIKFTGASRTDLEWAAARERQGYVTLTGEAPSASAKRRVLQYAQDAFPEASVSDQMRIVGGAEEPWLTAATRGLSQLAVLRRGEVSLNGKQLRLTGVAESDALAERVRKTMASGLPSGVVAEVDVNALNETQREADRCETLMRATTARGIINFERARADLTNDSTETLREVADIANECPRFRIEIEGHTDSEGTDERNQRLSDRRAASVARYLVRLGVSPDRLTTIGYGATRPIADNDTARGRARNRRIEFVVQSE